MASIPEPTTNRSDAIAKIGDIAAAAGLRRIHVLAWRDLADVEGAQASARDLESDTLSDADLEELDYKDNARG